MQKDFITVTPDSGNSGGECISGSGYESTV